jgi:hypothetical protein
MNLVQSNYLYYFTFLPIPLYRTAKLTMAHPLCEMKIASVGTSTSSSAY